MADVSININGTDERNGSVVVGAPRGIATSTERFGAGSNYTLLPGSSGVGLGAVSGHNDETVRQYYISKLAEVRAATSWPVTKSLQHRDPGLAKDEEFGF